MEILEILVRYFFKSFRKFSIMKLIFYEFQIFLKLHIENRTIRFATTGEKIFFSQRTQFLMH